MVYELRKGITYEWRVISDAKDSPDDWPWPYCCKVTYLRTFEPAISLSELCKEIPQKDWNAPHVNMKVKTGTIIPEHVAEKIRALRPSVPGSSVNDVPEALPPKIEGTNLRIVRDTEICREIKRLYGCRCQVCGLRLELKPGDFYAEGHHIRPLGGLHKGLDVRDNILCLCPNHHVLFDNFAIRLDPARLRFKKHDLRQSFVDYHNAQLAKAGIS